MEQYESVIGILIWLVRICRADIAMNVSKLQQNKTTATIADLKLANKTVRYAKEHVRRGLTCTSGTVNWDDMVVVVVTDASFAEEKDPKSGEPYRSQGGKIIMLATPSALDGKEMWFHPVSFSSNILRRVCRATYQAETYQLQLGVESGDLIRAAIIGMKETLGKDWVTTSAAHMQMIWYTDCNSTVTSLQRPVMGKITDKRLGIELTAMRQSIWRRKGERVGETDMDTMPTKDDATDIVYWVDTDVMLADALTKMMGPEKLVEALEVNYWDVKQPIASLAKK